jgi:chemotaxis protein MotB
MFAQMYRVFVLLLVVGVAVGCVPTRKYRALSSELEAHRALAERNRLAAQHTHDSLRTANTALSDSLAALSFRLSDLETGVRERLRETENLRQDLDQLRSASSTELRQALIRMEELRQDVHIRELRLADAERRLAEQTTAVQSLADRLNRQLAPFRAQGLEVLPEPCEAIGQVRVLLADRLLFRLGSYSLDSTGRAALLQLAQVLRENPALRITVEGHTDSLPIRNLPGLRDNWELSTRRALEVVRFLQTEGRIAAHRCTAAGSGEWQPVAPNTTPEGQARNRRTEIIVRLPGDTER